MPETMETEHEPEHKYASQMWIWVLLFLIIFVGLIALVAMILPFVWSPTYPNGYNIYQISTKINGNDIVPNDTVTAINRNLYIFNTPSGGTGSVTTRVTIANLSLAGVKKGMQMLVYNNTAFPLNVTSGSTSPNMSPGISLAGVKTPSTIPEKMNCIPTNISEFGAFKTTSIIPPGGTFLFVSPSDNNLNLVQTTPIDALIVSEQVTLPNCSITIP